MKPLSTTNVGGGVWRLKWHPNKANELLVGCMHDGFKVLSLNQLQEKDEQVWRHSGRHIAWPEEKSLEREEMTLLCRFDDHQSLAYGCDWDRGIDKKGHTNGLVYSCSFYDAKLHIWRSAEER